MRLDHLLSKDRFVWGGLPPPSFLVVCFVWAGVVWAGLEGVSRTEAAAGWPCAVVWGWLVVVLCGVGNTPVMLLLPACVGSVAWWVPPRALVCVGVACCRGSGAVRPGCLARASAACWWVVGCGCGWVGCELYSGREHLTVSLRQVFCRVLCCLFL